MTAKVRKLILVSAIVMRGRHIPRRTRMRSKGPAESESPSHLGPNLVDGRSPGAW